MQSERRKPCLLHLPPPLPPLPILTSRTPMAPSRAHPPQRRIRPVQSCLTGVLTILGAAVLAPFTGNAQTKGAEKLAPVPLPSRNIPAGTSASVPTDAPIQMRVGPYFGWDRSWTLSNGKAEAVVVPAIGRIMQFRFVGKPGPFWEDASLRGKSPDPSSSEWGNFGGDKTWPSPQADWEKVTGRGWPPPVAFDSMPVETSVRRDALVLQSPVDPHFGIRTERVIRLLPDAPVLSIVTTYEKVSGATVNVGVWIITQLEDPVAAFARLPAPSLFPDGYNRQSGDVLPKDLKVEDRWLSLTRDPARSTKIGTDGDALLWVGHHQMLLIESPRIPSASYPDQQSSAEIYTNPNPKTYVELEMLGPVHALAPGDRISQTNTYTLMARSHPDPATDARRALFPTPAAKTP